MSFQYYGVYMDTKMFCYQCEQTANGSGCSFQGVCGKTAEVAVLQDLLIYALKGLSCVAIKAREKNINTTAASLMVIEGLFATVTNVDFTEAAIAELIKKAVHIREALFTNLGLANCACEKDVRFTLPATIADMITLGKSHPLIDQAETNIDIQSLKSTLLFGLKGMAAYAEHAKVLGAEDVTIFHFIEKALANMLRYDLDIDAWLGLLMECGQTNLRTMELLDQANTGHYGHPVPTKVPLGTAKGPAILISGHDLKDLELLLQQTEGKGISIYTHGEMLPAHGYPMLHKYKHLHGHFGTAWQNQRLEFAQFPGAILMTTNCIQKPQEAYQDNIFTTGLVEWPGVTHIGVDKDFTAVINKALATPGFAADTEQDFVMVGFAHNAVLSIADKIVAAVKAGKIKHFFLVGGCDGAKPGRDYYTNFVEQVPQDCLVLTLACGKFRFFTHKLGDIDGIPRLLDIGQCNDAYSAIQIALALAKAFNCSVNELPLSLILSWYEQKAVAILLTLLSLGIKNIRLGPTLPAFVSPKVLDVLIDKFSIKLIDTPAGDLAEILI